ncbi:LCP family protein [Streptomyces sp. NPDC000594]|uniref:LCP family protein n=1 Tax=Streptomyces sp. NPDC000594 TaxID=3154261 RepID=UPI0033233BAE
MNDQHSPYDPYGPQPRLIGYDEYGQPVYEQLQQYDPYAHQTYQQPYPAQQQHQQQQYQEYQQYQEQSAAPQGVQGYAPSHPAPAQPAPPYDPSAPGAAPYDPYTPHPSYETPAPGRQIPVPERPAALPDHPAPVTEQPVPVPEQRAFASERRLAGAEDAYRTEQFSFIEEPDDASEDVIDWLKFTESRSERREEARRRGRNRIVALVVTVALVLVGGAGYLWLSGGFSGDSGEDPGGTAAGGAQKRAAIVVHLHNTKKKGTSTALLVDNSTSRQGTTVLLPNTLAVTNDDGTGTTLAESVDEDGSEGTREAIGALFGAKITSTWRLDTPFLENLVELVGTVDLTTDTEVPAPKGGDPLVRKGEDQTLNGRAAVAYATHRGSGEPETRQLQRFGQVMQAVLRKMPSDARSATVTVETLGQILEPPLTESALGASLATLSEYAKGGDYRTELLPVQEDGGLTARAADDVVKKILGGSVTAPEKGAAVRVAVRDAGGAGDAPEKARVLLVNGGYAVVDSGRTDPAATSEVTYGDEAHRAEAAEVAKTLGLPGSAVRKAAPAPNAEITVLLGQDFRADG